MMGGMPSFGENLKAAMTRGGRDDLSDAKQRLASALKVSTQQVDKYLSMDANPRLSSLFKLAKTLKVSIESLCEGVDPDYDATRIEAPTEGELLELYRRLDDATQRSVVLPVVRLAAGAPILATPPHVPDTPAPQHGPPSEEAVPVR